ncbi:MORN repeat-containing protein [Novymonas esmeraldas]|uniref:MORN repeat-containing protein n=1 Tax=Novymonas esmeraldas TaxID=1808958 RepID=A0AAW0ESB8_9TRYP
MAALSSSPPSALDGSGTAAPPPPLVQHVLYATLVCTRVPGPPLVAPSPAPAPPRPTSPAVSDGNTATSIPSSSSSPPPAVASSHASATPIHAAHHFLATSGASLLSYAGVPLHLTARNGTDSEELNEECQGNLLASPAAAAAMKDRYDGGGGGGVEWRKMEWVRQQCRYTGDAYTQQQQQLQQQQTTTHRGGADGSRRAAAPLSSPPRLPAAAAATTVDSGEAAERSVGVRIMQSLLYPFTQPAAAAVAEDTSGGSSSSGGGGVDTVVPHGRGVMTYLLLCKPKVAGYGYPAAAATPTAPFLPPDLVPHAYAPPLTALDGAATTAATSPTSPPPPPRLLLLSLVVYEGPFTHGRRHGRGRLTVHGRLVLECTWSNDVPCLAVPRPLVSAAASPPAPVLWYLSGHQWTPAAPAHARTAAAATGSWSVLARQAYMGSVTLAAVAHKRLHTAMESIVGAVAAVDLHGTRYVPLPSPHRAASRTRADASSAAFRGLGWVEHVVLLPDGFGEMHQQTERGDTTHHPVAAAPLLVPAHRGPYHPHLWAPTAATAEAWPIHSPYGAPAPCWQYCGEWSAGLPSRFGVVAERLTDPAAVSVASSGPPQYPWRTLFLGKHVRGERCGPGVYHGPQGSEAAEAVLCGTWPHGEDAVADANVVLLPVSSCASVSVAADTPSRAPPPLSTSFFTLQGTRWSATDAGDVDGSGSGGGGGGVFPTATLRQSAAALGGMWEPLCHAVDDVVAQQSPSLLMPADSGEDGGGGGGGATDSEARPSRAARRWRQAYRVMDAFIATPECAAALGAFTSCFMFVYGTNTTASPPSSPAQQPSASTAREETAAGGLLRRLASATATAATPASGAGYPWCPAHSWCAVARLGRATAASQQQQQQCGAPAANTFLSCLHEGLEDGVTHRRLPPTTSLGGARQTSRHGSPHAGLECGSSEAASPRPPLSSVAAALEPFAAAHTFTHAMHAAAAFVSSLRLRLLSCFAAHPDLCEVVMGSPASEDKVAHYSWDVVFRCVGAVLAERATAVAVADVRLVWALLLPEHAPRQETKETLTDFCVAVRRCRALRVADMVDDAAAAGVSLSQLEACVARLRRAMETAPIGAPAKSGSGSLQDMMGSLAQLAAALGTADAAVATPAQREALLRWTLCTAAAAAAGPCQPFALLLISHFTLSGRVAPACPLLVGDDTPTPSRHDILRLVAEMARATRQLMHTYPSIRSHTALSPVSPEHRPVLQSALVCPLDTLALKLECVLSPCAALHLSASPQAHLVHSAVLEATAGPEEGGGAATSGSADQVYIAARRLPLAVRRWCQRVLSDEATEPVLQARLRHYWDRLAPSRAEQGDRQRRPGAVGGTLVEPRDTAPPPSPLMQWTLACLQSVLSRPLLLPPQQQQQQAGGTRPPHGGASPIRRRSIAAMPSAPPSDPAAVLPTRYTWKRFISAVFLRSVEKEGWATTAAAVAPPQALTTVDACYVTALAYTLRELAGLELELTARLVLDSEDDDDDNEGVLPESVAVVAKGSSDVPRVTASSLPTAQLGPPRRRHPKNIFLSSSSSSSDSPAVPALPLPQQQQQPDTSGNGSSDHSDGRDDDDPSRRHNTEAMTAPSTQSSTPQAPRSRRWRHTPRFASAHATPRADRTPSDRRPRSESPTTGAGAEVAASPTLGGFVGKEWTLTLTVLSTSEDVCEQEKEVAGKPEGTDAVVAASAPPPPQTFFRGLAWEVMEQTCARVLHQLPASTAHHLGDTATDDRRQQATSVRR